MRINPGFDAEIDEMVMRDNGKGRGLRAESIEKYADVCLASDDLT